MTRDQWKKVQAVVATLGAKDIPPPDILWVTVDLVLEIGWVVRKARNAFTQLRADLETSSSKITIFVDDKPVSVLIFSDSDMVFTVPAILRRARKMARDRQVQA